MAQSIYRVSTENGLVISGFLDHNLPMNPSLNGLPILGPENGSDAIVVIGIHNRDAEIPPIMEKLKLSGALRVITPIELYDFFGDQLGTRYWLTKRDYYLPFKSAISEAESIWADEASQSLYTSIIQFRIEGDYSLLPRPDLANQYFPPTIPAWKTPLRFIDCGAYDGDTLQNIDKLHIPIEALAAFEPDQANFQRLVKYVQEKQIQNTFLWPCGVYSFATQLKFSSGHGEASVISQDGLITIQCVSLDESVSDFKPTLIKMDIEGAEIEAIHGAQKIIQKIQPGLAISAYHLPSHIWEIPLLIKHMMPDAYKYYLRAHGFNDFDVVLYAVPI